MNFGDLYPIRQIAKLKALQKFPIMQYAYWTLIMYQANY